MSLRVLTQGGGTGGASASIFITGLSETDTVNAVKNGKTVRGKWTQKPILPNGYTQLEYIESTGDAYINTQYVANANTEIEFEASTESSVEFGARIGSQNNAFLLSVQYTNKCARFHFANNAYAEFAVTDANNRHTYTIKGNGTCYMDGVLKKTLSGSFSNNFPVYVFCINNGGSKGNGAGKVYRVKITDGTVVRDYYPARRNSDGVLGMYDLANNVFYTNAGNGEFIAGPESPYYVYGHLISKIKEYGMYTITATDGERTTTQDVLVDAAVEYEIGMRYILYLYNAGDECEEVTGGWVSQGLGYESAYNVPDAPILTKNSANMVVSRTSTKSYAAGIAKAVNNIDFTKYKTINAIVDTSPVSEAVIFGCYYRSGGLGQYIVNGTRWATFLHSSGTVQNKQVSASIEKLSGMYAVYFGLYSTGSYTVKKVWLE